MASNAKDAAIYGLHAIRKKRPKYAQNARVPIGIGQGKSRKNVLLPVSFMPSWETIHKSEEDFLKKKKLKLPDGLLAEAIRFNRVLIKLPFQKKDLDISLKYNLFEVYQGALKGRDASIEKGNFCYSVNRTSQKWTSWNEWLKEVVWYGSKRGAYIYDCRKR